MRYHHAKLEDPKDFKLWKQMLEINLQARGLLKHVKDDKPPPERPTQLLSDPEAFNRWMDWAVNETKAKNMIGLSVSKGISIGNYGETAHAIFSNLVQHYERIPVNKYALFGVWRGLQWDGTMLPQFMREWSSALRHCFYAGVPISEEVKVLTFVDMVSHCGNSKYEIWAKTMMALSIGKELPGLLEVTEDLRHVWKTNRIRRLEMEERKDRCGVCGVKGHTPTSCWHLHPELGPQRFHPKKGLVRAFKERMEIDDEDGQGKAEDEGDDEDEDDEHERILKNLFYEINLDHQFANYVTSTSV